MEVVYFSMEETLICPVEIWPDESTRKSEMTVRRVMEENLVPLKMGLDSEIQENAFFREWEGEFDSWEDIPFGLVNDILDWIREQKNGK
jgi:hypothetical protein